MKGSDEKTPVPADTDKIATQVVDAIYAVHSKLGPGLLESAYDACLAHELKKRGVAFKKQVDMPIVYEGIQLETGYRLNFLVEDCLIIGLKAVDDLLPIHMAKLLTYLKLSGCRVGLLMNFNCKVLKDGLRRVVA